MSDHACLNCGQPTELKYCAACGQAAHTHRFSLNHIFSHDFLHGVFHFDKGFFYTTRELLLRPGHTTHSYIAGKRVQHFNYFAYILLLIAIYHLVVSASGFKISGIVPLGEDMAIVDKLQQLWLDNYKLLVFATLPIYALFTFLIFRRAKLNYAEHLVLNAYRQGGELAIAIIIIVVTFPFRHATFARYLYLPLACITPLYSLWFYMQHFSRYYKSKYFLLQRAMLVQILVMMSIAVLARLLLPGYLEAKLGMIK